MTLDPTQAYHMLGLAPGATPDEVKAAYRDLAQVWHPDRFPDNERLREKAQRNLQRINEAYLVLRDHAASPPASAVAVAPPPARHPSLGRRISDSFRGRRLRHSLFTGVAAVRHSLEVLWPSATYARRRRRRLPPTAWIALGVLVLLFVATVLAALWFWGRLR
ncbi:MAG: J domain-containing protein [Gemmatimonadales bacterium]